MKKFRCNIHALTIQIPSSEDEFLTGKYHSDIEKCSVHHDEFPKCLFKEVQEK